MADVLDALDDLPMTDATERCHACTGCCRQGAWRYVVRRGELPIAAAASAVEQTWFTSDTVEAK